METTFSKKFNFFQFLKFVLPAIASMVFLSLYTIIDGIFVSNLVGADALASINIILPLTSFIWGISIMFGTGGGAIISKFLGEENLKEASESMSLFTFFPVLLGVIFGALSFIFIEDLSYSLGATNNLISYCIPYGSIICIFTPIFIFKTILEFYIRSDGNFSFSLFLSIIGGVINIILDYVFIKILGFGISGAALATGLGVLFSTLCGIGYFLSKKSTLKFKKFKFDFKRLYEAMLNGSSQMVTELSTGITTFLFNLLALKYAGETGVAALTIVLYAQFFLVSTYLGFATGISPLFSYNFGAQNYPKLKETFKHSIKFLALSSVLIFILSIVFSKNLIGIFVSSDNEVFSIALTGLLIFSLSFLVMGFNVFASGLFTSFGSGIISSIISFSRAFAFILIGAAFLPNLFDLNGVWLIVPFAEILTLALSFYLIKKYKPKYNY
ncbi:MATE efflux family protein [Clostridium thermobutyricum]|uniref:MATE efflux family protein n=1 Tax=Clostridium thermobutyricum TaxID=29372 RepID=N9Y373_9CLOT|nr:MATE family efflux transporter [Clostridium thermobutyricum]ENZ02242.1 MATE efflux family protein [Clostridium thermobutyricum]